MKEIISHFNLDHEIMDEEQTKEASREELILNNIRLVFQKAKEYDGGYFDFEDRFQFGLEGLMRAADKFEAGKGKFSTYATWWIKKKINRAKKNFGRNIRMPAHRWEMGNLEEFELTDTTSLDKETHQSPYGGDEETRCLIDLQPDEEQGYREIEQADADDRMIDEMFAALDEQQKEMISKYYGLFDGRERSLRELEREYDYSYEWIRQKINLAIEKMRKVCITK